MWKYANKPLNTAEEDQKKEETVIPIYKKIANKEMRICHGEDKRRSPIRREEFVIERPADYRWSDGER